MLHSDEKKSETSVQVYEATNDIYALDDTPGLDRVYHAKARLLNNALQEIGMGKYQVRLDTHSPKNVANPSRTVVALLRGWFRVASRQSVACMSPCITSRTWLTSGTIDRHWPDFGPRHERVFFRGTIPQTWPGEYPLRSTCCQLLGFLI